MLGIKTICQIDEEKFICGNSYYLNGEPCNLVSKSTQEVVFKTDNGKEIRLTVNDILSGKYECTTPDAVRVIGYEDGFDV